MQYSSRKEIIGKIFKLLFLPSAIASAFFVAMARILLSDSIWGADDTVGGIFLAIFFGILIVSLFFFSHQSQQIVGDTSAGKRVLQVFVLVVLGYTFLIGTGIVWGLLAEYFNLFT